jgi:hypothetical protein
MQPLPSSPTRVPVLVHSALGLLLAGVLSAPASGQTVAATLPAPHAGRVLHASAPHPDVRANLHVRHTIPDRPDSSLFERERFDYTAALTRDPFVPLAGASPLLRSTTEIRFDNLSLAGILVGDGGRSIALFQSVDGHLMRLHLGDRRGDFRVAAITPDGVDVDVSFLGITSRQHAALPSTRSESTP